MRRRRGRWRRSRPCCPARERLPSAPPVHGRAESGSRFTIAQRSSRFVMLMAPASIVSPNKRTPPTHSSSSKGTARSDAIWMFGRNLRTSDGWAASLAISPTVAEVIAEILASSKIPRLRCIISTRDPWRRPTSIANSSPEGRQLFSIRGANVRREVSVERRDRATVEKKNQFRKLRGAEPGNPLLFVNPPEREPPIAVESMPA